MPDKEIPEEEELLKDRTMIRKLGNVWGVTFPSALMKNKRVKNNKGKQTSIRLVRIGKRYRIEVDIPFEVSLDGRILKVRRKKE